MGIFKKKKARTAQLVQKSAGLAFGFASNKAKSFFQSDAEKKQAEAQFKQKLGYEITALLSDMKGPLMKLGQIFSQVKDVLPVEISSALGELRHNAKPIPFEEVKQTIELAFGKQLEAIYERFDPVAFRAASLGQVHKALLKTGEAVVVKVQYPNIAVDCQTDLKSLKTILKLLPLLGIDKKSAQDIYLEAEEIIARELDYLLEAQSAQLFYDFFKDDDQVVIPKVFEDYCRSNVLTLEYVQGASLMSLHAVRSQNRGDEALTEKIANNLLACVLRQIFELKTIHVDPHAGNFAYKPDGRLVVYDFGAVKTLSPDTVGLFSEMVEACLTYDYDEIERLLIFRNIRKLNTEALGESYYKPWFDLVNAPFIHKRFHFGESQLHIHAANYLKHNWRQHMACFSSNRDTLMLDRLLVGQYWNLVHLSVEFSPKNLLQPYVSFEIQTI